MKTNQLYLTGCLKNEVKFHLIYLIALKMSMKRFTGKIESFTGGKIMLIVLRSTRNTKSLFPLKDKVVHRSCVLYEGKCSCGLSYIGETKIKSEVRWKEHEDPAGKSEPAKHLIENAPHKSTWKILSIAPSHFRRRKILEAYLLH